MSDLKSKVEESNEIIRSAISEVKPQAVMALYSGGNDSAAVLHLVHSFCHKVIHVNTGIGIEETRRHVRKTVKSLGKPLIEEKPDRQNSYRELVLEYGFPGPSFHKISYARLKERQLDRICRITLGRPYGEFKSSRIMYLAGIRASESKRRARYAKLPSKGIMDRSGRTVFVSPIYNWSRENLDEYREVHKIKENPVSAKIHMSGECLCGAYAHPGEREELKFWYPEFIKQIIEPLEEEVKRKWNGSKNCVWGPNQFSKSTTVDPDDGYAGPLCHNCAPKLAEMISEATEF